MKAEKILEELQESKLDVSEVLQLEVELITTQGRYIYTGYLQHMTSNFTSEFPVLVTFPLVCAADDMFLYITTYLEHGAYMIPLQPLYGMIPLQVFMIPLYDGILWDSNLGYI